MNIQLKAKLQVAIDKVINDNCYTGDYYWNVYIHDELYDQMTNAAEMVFDASMMGQKYAKEQSE